MTQKLEKEEDSSLMDDRKSFKEEYEDALSSIKTRKIILPILIGIGVVAYIFYNQYDPAEFARIQWSAHSVFWIAMGVLLFVVRHLAYSFRLRVLSEYQFSWLKCIQLIFIWEFSSAVSPSAIGGSAVAVFVLSQEKLGAAKTATIVLYTVVLDSLFFIISVPLLLMFFGTEIIRPDMSNVQNIDGWGYAFFGAYIFMFSYASIFAIGLFVSPRWIHKFFSIITSVSLLKRFRNDALKLANDMMEASEDMQGKAWGFHLKCFFSTAIAWSCRFLLLNCLIIGIVESVPMTLHEQGTLYSRLLSMFVIMAFSPTPGGAGFAEILFGGFLKDYVPEGISVIVASIWRLLTYYSYLFAGAIIIPQWITSILKERKNSRN